MFAIIFFRLWFLQVLSGNQYLRTRPASTACATSSARAAGPDPRPQRQHPRRAKPRDRGPDLAAGPAGADHRQNLAHPPSGRALYDRLAGVLGPADERVSRARWTATGVLAPVRRSPAASRRDTRSCPTRTSRSRATSQATSLYYLRAPAPSVPGRDRPAGLAAHATRSTTLAAQLFGTVGPITGPETQATPFYTGVTQNDSSGSRGSSATTTATCAESTAPSGSRSTRSATSSALQSQTSPTAGHNLKLSLDLDAAAGRAAGAPGVDRHEPARAERRRVRGA